MHLTRVGEGAGLIVGSKHEKALNGTPSIYIGNGQQWRYLRESPTKTPLVNKGITTG